MHLKRSRLIIVFFVAFMDVLILSASLYVAYYARFYTFIRSIFPATKGLPDWGIYQNLVFVIIPLSLFMFINTRLYKVIFISFLDELVRLTRVMTICIFFLVLIVFFYREISYSRLVFVLYWSISITLLLVFRETLKLGAKYYLRSFLSRENLLIIGKENKMLKMILKQHPNYQVTYFPFDALPKTEKIKELVRDKNISQIIMTGQIATGNELLNFYDFCESVKIDLKIVPDILQLCRGEIQIDSSLDIPIFHIRSTSLTGFNFYIKKIVDLILSIIILSLTWPVILFMAVMIIVDSKGSIIYTQDRMGYNGKIFKFIKFRTMVKNADDLLEKYKNMSERKGPVFKMTNDPRVTKIGRILRRFSLDEIPQVINVLRGEMSLVGPRPQVLWEAAAYNDWSKRRLRVLPGITGLWQVSGRASLSYQEMIELDIYYIENWSLGRDIEILLKTPAAVLGHRGAS